MTDAGSRVEYPRNGGGGGDFFLVCEELGGSFYDLLPDCAVFFVCLFVLKWRSARDHQSRFLGQDQSIVVQRAEMTVAECPLTSCVCACFPDMFPH